MSESTFRQIKIRCFKTSVLTAFFLFRCASRSPSFDGSGFLMGGCLALLALRAAMLTLVGTACRRRIHLPPPFEKNVPESTSRQINLRCFKASVLTAFFLFRCASRSHLAMGVDSLLLVALRFLPCGLRCSRSSALRAAVESTFLFFMGVEGKTSVLTAFFRMFYCDVLNRSVALPDFSGI